MASPLPHPFRLVVPIALGVLCLAASVARAEDPQAWVGKNLDSLQALYRHFHTNPELSFQETKTAARLAEELKKVGIEVTTNIGRQGVVGILKNGPGPTVMVRTDLDGLPVTEATGLPYASKVSTKDKDGNDVGVMHACGHDIHITCLIGTARYLAANKDSWSGTVMLIGQPAALKLHLKAGDKVSLSVNTSNGDVLEQTFIIRGIYTTNTYGFDGSIVFLPLAKAQALNTSVRGDIVGAVLQAEASRPR
jgi:hypothetical protein